MARLTNERQELQLTRHRSLQLYAIEERVLAHIWPLLYVLLFEFLHSDDDRSLTDISLTLGMHVQQLPFKLQLGKSRDEK